MDDQPTFGDFVLGLEGLAIMRAWSIDPQLVRTRASKIAAHVANLGSELLSKSETAGERSVVAGYTDWAPAYDAPGNPILVGEQAVVQGIIERYAIGTALDAACGTGRHAFYLATLGHEVIGIDATPAMLEVARAKVPSARFELGELEALPLEDSSVDVAVCTLALTHLPDLTPAIEELARVVRPGGHVVISDVHPFGVMLGAQARYPLGGSDHGFVRNYVHLPSAYLTAFATAGLEVTACVEPRWGATELATFPWADKMPDLLEAAVGGAPIVIVWETVRQ